MSDQLHTPVALLWAHKLNRDLEGLINRFTTLENALQVNNAALEQKIHNAEVEINALRGKAELSEKALLELRDIPKGILKLYDDVAQNTERLTACSERIEDKEIEFLVKRQKQIESTLKSLTDSIKSLTIDANIDSKIICLETQLENLKSDGQNTTQNFAVITKDVEANKAQICEIWAGVAKLDTILNKQLQNRDGISKARNYSPSQLAQAHPLQSNQLLQIKPPVSYIGLPQTSHPVRHKPSPHLTSMTPPPIPKLHESSRRPNIASGQIVQDTFRNSVTPTMKSPLRGTRNSGRLRSKLSTPSSLRMKVAETPSNSLVSCQLSSNDLVVDLGGQMPSRSHEQNYQVQNILPNENSPQPTLAQDAMTQQPRHDLRLETSEARRRARERRRLNASWTLKVFRSATVASNAQQSGNLSNMHL